MSPRRKVWEKAWRSFGSPTPDTAVWGHSPDVPVWRDGDRKSERGWLMGLKGLSRSLKKPSFDGRVESVSLSGRLNYRMAVFSSFFSFSSCTDPLLLVFGFFVCYY